MKRFLAGVVLSLSLVGCGIGPDEAQAPADQTAQSEQAIGGACGGVGASCGGRSSVGCCKVPIVLTCVVYIPSTGQGRCQ
jgi:hypothetical protein